MRFIPRFGRMLNGSTWRLIVQVLTLALPALTAILRNKRPFMSGASEPSQGLSARVKLPSGTPWQLLAALDTSTGQRLIWYCLKDGHLRLAVPGRALVDIGPEGTISISEMSVEWWE